MIDWVPVPAGPFRMGRDAPDAFPPDDDERPRRIVALDAFRIFDNIFIMTGGSQNTSSVGVLAYNQTITRSQIGLGSAISILLFVLVIAISTVFIKGFKTDLSKMGG